MKRTIEKNEDVVVRRQTPTYVLRTSTLKRIVVGFAIVCLVIVISVFSVYWLISSRGFELHLVNATEADIEINLLTMNDRKKYEDQVMKSNTPLWISDTDCPPDAKIQVEWSVGDLKKVGSCTISNVKCGCAYEASISKDGVFCSQDCTNLND